MATVSVPTDRDGRVVVPSTWETYRALLRERGDRCRPRYIYLDGRLTIMSPGASHEFWKSRLGALIEILFEELGIDFHPTGSTTLLDSRGSRTGVEADESYYLSRIGRVVGKSDLVMGIDPAPDLVVEVVVSHGESEAIEAYRRFGVREVWVCKADGLSFRVLGEDGQYCESPVSSLIPTLATSIGSSNWMVMTSPTPNSSSSMPAP